MLRLRGRQGLSLPELTGAATAGEAGDLDHTALEGYFSSSRTCEIGMTRATGKIYRSYLHLLDYVSRP